MSRTIKGILTRKKRVALFVDGPNILRKDFNIRLEDLYDTASKYGKVIISKVYLNPHAPKKLAEAVSNSGLTPEIVSSDIHVKMAVDALSLIFREKIDVLVIASRHARCSSILRRAKELGVETVVIGFNPGFSVALKNTADYYEELNIGNSVKK
ncbi:MAG: NYN domain-containing protein [Candidatus Asgardarchaeia archaeon]